MASKQALSLAGTVGRELSTVAITLLGLLAVTFFIARVMPVDPVLAVVGDRAPADVYERARLELGLDKPLIVQFWIYLQKVFSGDFGKSVLTSNPKQGRWPDHLARFIGLFGYSVPIFWLGLMGLLLFYAKLGWVSGPGRIGISYQDFIEPITGVMLLDCALQGDWDAFRNAASHLILPSSCLGLFSTAYISRMTRSFMIQELQQQYIITARVKGMSETRVIWRHGLRNAMVPLLTVIALSYATLLEGSVLTETVFAWPGLGRYITNSLLSADMNAVLGGTIVVGAVFVGINLLTDLLARILDPRAR